MCNYIQLFQDHVFHEEEQIGDPVADAGMQETGSYASGYTREGRRGCGREEATRVRGGREDAEKGKEEKGGRSYVSIPPPEVGGPRNRLRGRSAIRPTVSVRVPDVCSSRLASARSSSRGPTCAAVPRGRFLRLSESIIVGSIIASLLPADQSAIGVYLIRQYRRVPRDLRVYG